MEPCYQACLETQAGISPPDPLFIEDYCQILAERGLVTDVLATQMIRIITLLNQIITLHNFDSAKLSIQYFTENGKVFPICFLCMCACVSVYLCVCIHMLVLGIYTPHSIPPTHQAWRAEVK